MKNNRRLLWLISILVVMSGLYVIYNNTHKNNGSQEPKVKIVAVGDSLTQGVGDKGDRGGYPVILKKQINQNYQVKAQVANLGVAGETSTQIKQRITNVKPTQKQVKQADIVVLTAGGNDLIHFLRSNIMETNPQKLQQKVNRYLPSYHKRMNNLVRTVRKNNAQAEIYVLGVYNPVYKYFPNVHLINRVIYQANTKTKSLEKTNPNVHYVTINKWLSKGGKVKQKTNQLISDRDHFHPNKRGYEYISNQLLQEIKANNNWQERE